MCRRQCNGTRQLHCMRHLVRHMHRSRCDRVHVVRRQLTLPVKLVDRGRLVCCRLHTAWQLGRRQRAAQRLLAMLHVMWHMQRRERKRLLELS